ncbi:MAG: hypothetical protein KatS3mg087_0527 [Patescibacteria group bacterium]|jgi:3-polyprenyl-4-hydroxybenzoate decarboxylase|nr:MAG: hypothetical protein KatS3mg087_0527 [Patescibacteria group bacterium]
MPIESDIRTIIAIVRDTHAKVYEIEDKFMATLEEIAGQLETVVPQIQEGLSTVVTTLSTEIQQINAAIASGSVDPATVARIENSIGNLSTVVGGLQDLNSQIGAIVPDAPVEPTV